MRNMILAAAAFPLLAIPQTASAEARLDANHQALDTCIEGAGPDDLAIKDCYAALAIAEDARLYRNWTALMRAVGGPIKQVGAALQKEQRAWISFRDKACQNYLTADSGTLDRLQSQICYTKNISDRADYLGRLAEDYAARNQP